MKNLKRVLAVMLAAAFAFLMLTACSDGAEPAKNDYGKMIESAMNAARREYNLPDVKYEVGLESYAKKNEANHSVNGWQYAEINGKKYKIKHLDSGAILKKGMTFETWKSKFTGYIKSSQDSSLSATFHGVAEKALTYIGLWTAEENGQIKYCIVGAFPEA